MSTTPLLTIEQHILLEQRRNHPQATGEFSWLLSGLTLSAKMISAQVRRAGLVGILGAAGQTNVQGEIVQKLDIYANQALLHCLGHRGCVAVMASEENEEPVFVPRDRQHGRYVVVFDPLDGSSNIDVNVSVGTIFAIYGRDPDHDGAAIRSAMCCNPGCDSWRRVTLFTVPRRCWSTQQVPASSASRSTRALARSSSATSTSPCRRRATTIRSTRPTPTRFRSRIAIIWRICDPGRQGGRIRRATSVRWWRIFTGRCSRAECFCIRRPGSIREANCTDVRGQSDCVHRGAGGRCGDGWPWAHSGHHASELASAGAAAGGQPGRDGTVDGHVEEIAPNPGPAFCRWRLSPRSMITSAKCQRKLPLSNSGARPGLVPFPVTTGLPRCASGRAGCHPGTLALCSLARH